MTSLVFDDLRGLADFATFLARAATLDRAGAVRLQAVGMTLAAHVQVLPGRGLLAEGGVVAMRAMALDVPLDLDVVVPIAALTDRLARHPGSTELPVPPTTVVAPWASLTPPRDGWEPVGEVAEKDLADAARAGIAEVATDASALRSVIWGRMTPTSPPVPAGAAFAAHVLGFLAPDGHARVLSRGRWVRVAATHGHVLVR